MEQSRQTHFGTRAPGKKKPGQAVLVEPHDNAFGVEISSSTGSLPQFKKKYREDQVLYQSDGAGAGLDEEVSTATTGFVRDDLATRGVPSGEIDQFVGNLSEEREEVKDEVYVTQDQKSIAAHPGGLTKKQTDGRFGITDEHNTKDSERAAIVRHEYLSGIAQSQPPAQLAENMKLQGSIETTKNFMSPYSGFSQPSVDPNNLPADQAYHPLHGALVDTSGGPGKAKWTPGMEQVARNVHNNRERRKIMAANRLMQQGKGSLVADEMHHLFIEAQQLGAKNPDDIVHYHSQAKQGQHDPLPPVSQTSRQDPQNPKTLAQMEAENQVDISSNQPRRHRAISAPRPYIMPAYKQQTPLVPQPSQTQGTLDDFWNAGSIG